MSRALFRQRSTLLASRRAVSSHLSPILARNANQITPILTSLDPALVRRNAYGKQIWVCPSWLRPVPSLGKVVAGSRQSPTINDLELERLPIFEDSSFLPYTQPSCDTFILHKNCMPQPSIAPFLWHGGATHHPSSISTR